MIIRDAQFLSAHFSLISWLSIPFSNIVLKIYSNANLTYFGKSVCLQKIQNLFLLQNFRRICFVSY